MAMVRLNLFYIFYIFSASPAVAVQVDAIEVTDTDRTPALVHEYDIIILVLCSLLS